MGAFGPGAESARSRSSEVTTKEQSMKPLSPAILTACIVAFASGPATAQSPLEHLPPRTAAVVQVRSIDALEGNFNDMLTAIGPITAPAGPGLQSALGEVFGVGQDLDALKRTAPAYAAVFALPTPNEPVARFVKASDESRLRRAVLRAGADAKLTTEKRDDGFEKVSAGSRTAFFGRRGDWIVYTSNEAVLPLLAFDAEAAGTFASALEPRAAELLDAGDASVVVNVAELTKQFADPINEAREQLITGIEQLPDEALQAGGSDPAATKKLYIGLANFAFDALFDTQWAAGRVNFSARGAGAEGALAVKQDSGTDKILAAIPPSPMEMLDLLPSGAPVYLGMRIDMQYVLSWYQSFLAAAVADDPAKAKVIETALDQFGKAGVGQIVAGFEFPADAESGMRFSYLFEADDTALLRSALVGYFRAFEEFKTPQFTLKFNYQAEAESYKDRAVDLVTERLEFPGEASPQVAVVKGLLSKLFGQDGLQVRIATIGNLLVEATGNDPKFLHGLIDGLESGEGVLGLSDAFATTRDELGEQANLVVLVDAPNLVVGVLNMLRDVPPFDMVIGQLPINFGAQPAASYAGISLGAEPQALRAHLFVPVEQPKGILQLFGQGP
jgi:hypothetical protein